MRSLYSRIALAFATILLLFGAVIGWLSYQANEMQQKETVQRLNRGLAAHIAKQIPASPGKEIDAKAVKELFHMLMMVNPNIEVYLLDNEGRVRSHSAPPGKVIRETVALPPIRAFLAGRRAPIMGDNPRGGRLSDVFSVAEFARPGEAAGFLYIILAGEEYREIVQDAAEGQVLRSASAIGGAALVVALLLGLGVFALITRRLNALASSVRGFQLSASDGGVLPTGGKGDEIAELAIAFEQMRARIDSQLQELQRQDELRRELVANVSHDLRTPLTSMQIYLETLQRKADAMPVAQRQEYLDIAVRHSQRVARLAQELFELARLECEETKPEMEQFSLAELMHDIAQKYSLAANQKGVSLSLDIGGDMPQVRGDIGMIERVITNLIDNALRFTPSGGTIRLGIQGGKESLRVFVADTGSGIASEHLASLFERGSPLREGRREGHGGLGLLIASRMVALHGGKIEVASQTGQGTQFSFDLPVASR